MFQKKNPELTIMETKIKKLDETNGRKNNNLTLGTKTLGATKINTTLVQF